jgi:hypothetical protein
MVLFFFGWKKHGSFAFYLFIIGSGSCCFHGICVAAIAVSFSLWC